MYKPIWPGTYYFKSFTFTSMGNSGHRGPTSNQTYADAPWPSPSYFSIKNGQQNWTVPANGVYQITAAGAYGATPGRVVTGQATLSQGQVLTMLVGQQPTPLTANVLDNVTVGGGGGTFVTTNGTPLIVASGGDGSGSTSSPGSFSPPGNGGGGSGAGYYGNGSGTNPFFQFLVPYSYVNGGYGNSYEYGQPTLTENGGFGGGQSPIGLLTPITQITGDGSFATCTTSVPHGYPFNYIVNISGTTYYDGVQTIQVLDPSTFVFASSNTETVSSGTVSGLVTGSSGGWRVHRKSRGWDTGCNLLCRPERPELYRPGRKLKRIGIRHNQSREPCAPGTKSNVEQNMDNDGRYVRSRKLEGVSNGLWKRDVRCRYEQWYRPGVVFV